jgi:hypothetical protein
MFFMIEARPFFLERSANQVISDMGMVGWPVPDMTLL